MDLVNLLEQKLDRLLDSYRDLQAEVGALREENTRLSEDRQQTVAEIDRILAKLDKV